MALLLLSQSLWSQKVTISGTLEDRNTGEKLISANVYESSTLKGVASNVYGFYSLTLPAGKVEIVYSYVGYQTEQIEIDLSRDTVINLTLEPVIDIDEVVISAERSRSAVRSTQMSMTELSQIRLKAFRCYWAKWMC
jgi:hypothetical protein